MASSENALTVLKVQLRELMNDRADNLLGGACRDFAEYRHMTGVIEGLAMAERELLDLQERIDKA